MEPTFQPGDIVWSHAGTAHVGEIVRVGGNRAEPYVHRVAAVRPDGKLTTKGDGDTSADGIPVRPADAEPVIAHVHRAVAIGAAVVLAMAMAYLWPFHVVRTLTRALLRIVRRRRSRQPSPSKPRSTAHTEPVRGDEHQREGEGRAGTVRRRDLRNV